MKQIWSPWRMEYIASNKEAGCIFCDMVESDDDAAQLVLYRGQLAFLVLNKYPYNNGHLMSVPYRHVSSLELLDPDELNEVTQLITLGIRVLREASHPEGFNVGFNIGKVAGAGVKDHVHGHIVPRWNGDTNFMPVLADVRMIPEAISDTYAELRDALERVLQSEDR
jgi:ATP adenylyltransferase